MFVFILLIIFQVWFLLTFSIFFCYCSVSSLFILTCACLPLKGYCCMAPCDDGYVSSCIFFLSFLFACCILSCPLSSSNCWVCFASGLFACGRVGRGLEDLHGKVPSNHHLLNNSLLFKNMLPEVRRGFVQEAWVVVGYRKTAFQIL